MILLMAAQAKAQVDFVIGTTDVNLVQYTMVVLYIMLVTRKSTTMVGFVRKVVVRVLTEKTFVLIVMVIFTTVKLY